MFGSIDYDPDYDVPVMQKINDFPYGNNGNAKGFCHLFQGIFVCCSLSYNFV